MKNWFVYILQCKNETFYTGITPNLQRRFQEHKEGRGGTFTKLSKIEKLVYFEKYFTEKEALKREKQLKGWCHKKKENLIRFGKPN